MSLIRITALLMLIGLIAIQKISSLETTERQDQFSPYDLRREKELLNPSTNHQRPLQQNNDGFFASFDWRLRNLLSEDRSFFVSLYGGRYTDRHLATKVLMFKPIDYEDSWLKVLAIGSIFYNNSNLYNLEYEVQFGNHIGEQQHQEYNIVGIFRWLYLPDIFGNPLSLAIGNGVSYATMTPPIEEKSRTNINASKWLNYLLIEGMLSLKNNEHWHLFGRIHHRSGVFGLYNGVRGGSNIMTGGLRYSF